jgi:hypothetical protein
MHTVPVLLLLAGAVILAGVVAVAMGHGGEMAEFPSDYVPPTLGDLLTAADVAMLRPPSALWGYNTQVTDEALSRIAQIVTERDVEIAVLRQQLSDFRSGTVSRPPASASRVAAEPVTAEPVAIEPVAAEPVADLSVAPDETVPAADDTGGAAQDEAPAAPVAPSDEAAAPGND